jgi:hypothetical protein
MKHNNFIQILFFLFVTVAYSNCQPKSPIKNYPEEQSIKFLREFYTKYITESSKSFVNVENENILVKQYCFKSLSHKLDSLQSERSLDFDPFLNSQMIFYSCISTLKFVMDPKDNQIYYVSYRLPNENNELVTTKIMVEYDHDTLRIRHIYCGNNYHITF